jgi:predicted RNase H-like nuclease (RuvC/YqgF family)
VSKWCPSTSFLGWLRGKWPAADHHDVEVKHRNLAQTKQLIQSSESRVSRAVETNERLRHYMTEAKQGLERNLDELARRVNRLQRSHDEEERKH